MQTFIYICHSQCGLWDWFNIPLSSNNIYCEHSSKSRLHPPHCKEEPLIWIMIIFCTLILQSQYFDIFNRVSIPEIVESKNRFSINLNISTLSEDYYEYYRPEPRMGERRISSIIQVTLTRWVETYLSPFAWYEKIASRKTHKFWPLSASHHYFDYMFSFLREKRVQPIDHEVAA